VWQLAPRHIPEERRAHQHRAQSLKSTLAEQNSTQAQTWPGRITEGQKLYARDTAVLLEQHSLHEIPSQLFILMFILEQGYMFRLHAVIFRPFL
jgi:hypothetical protein